MAPNSADADIQADPVGKTACPKCSHVMDLTGVAPFTAVQCPDCGMKFSAPGMLGPFVLLKSLGKGEMGATYKALEKGLRRFVAIKVMRKTLSADARRVKDFLAEARAVASLEHPNAVRLYRVGLEKGQPYIVMELIKGKAMDRAFSAERPMEEGRALEIGIGVTKALDAAAEIGLVHGDIKPANIMIDERDTPKLVDFGIARFAGARSGEGDVIGTPYYVSPEQVRHEPVDHRSDIYSLGATLYHALAGRPPFPGTNIHEVLNARLDAPAPDVQTARPDLHPKTAAVVKHMLEPVSALRPANLKGLLEELQLAFYQVTGLHTPEMEEVVGRPDIPMAEPLKPSRIWLKGLLAAVGLAVAAVAVWAFAFRGGGPTTDGPTSPASAPATVAAPIFWPESRSIDSPTDIEVRCDTAGSTIRYTIDGTEPTAKSRPYQQAIRVSPGTTLKARAFRDDLTPSTVAEAFYAAGSTLQADIVALRTEAEAAWRFVQKFNPAQGMDKKLDRARALYETAEQFYWRGDYKASRDPYGKLVTLCAQLEEIERQRAAAKDARTRATAAKTALEKLSGKVSPRSPTARQSADAKAAFEKGDFEQAAQMYLEVRKAFEQQMAEPVRKARSDWEAALAKSGLTRQEQKGKAWQDVGNALAAAEQAASDDRHAEAVAAYKRAAGLLSKAIAEARKGRAEAKRKADLDRVRALIDGGEFHKAQTELSALKLPSNYRPATDLRNLIQAGMNPTLALDQSRRQKVNLKLKWIPAGRFRMGSPADEADRSTNEEPHQVEITRPFFIGVNEVNRREFKAFVAAEKYQTQAQKEKWAYTVLGSRWDKIRDAQWDKPGITQNDDHPVTCVSWSDARAFCDWLGRKTKKTVRLPTEAEWEYACRAGATGAFGFRGKETDLHGYGNFADASAVLARGDKTQNDKYAVTAPVGKLRPNAWGLYDMHGNVAEWCADFYALYPEGAATDPTGPEAGRFRVVRGGAWTLPPKACRSASRTPTDPDYRTSFLGFRIVVETD